MRFLLVSHSLLARSYPFLTSFSLVPYLFLDCSYSWVYRLGHGLGCRSRFAFRVSGLGFRGWASVEVRGWGLGVRRWGGVWGLGEVVAVE